MMRTDKRFIDSMSWIKMSNTRRMGRIFVIISGVAHTFTSRKIIIFQLFMEDKPKVI